MISFDFLNTRDLIDWPEGPDTNQTTLGGVTFNLTTLKHFGYQLYDNGTVSNGSRCLLTYKPYVAADLLNNGSWVNSTKCYSAVDPIGPRGYAGIGVAVGFALALVLNITALAKHGPNYLPRDTRFYPIGRRWQWYWGIFVCATALIGLFTNVDVDRYHVQELPVVLTTFFWFLMVLGTVAQVWEAVRHWGSWQERQYIDPNQFVYGLNDRRAKMEFWMPMWFYFWSWLNFFLVVPRSWSFAEKQRSPAQLEEFTIPTATGIRFKAAAFTLVIAWLTILFSLRHSIKYYRPRDGGVFNKSVGTLKSVPLRFVLEIPLVAAVIAYQAMISFDFDFSLIKSNGPVPIIYGWGYGPSLLIMYIQIIYGFASPNEDKDLIRRRRERGEMLDRELGIVKRPAWWRRVRGEGTMLDKIRGNVSEVGGTVGIGRRVEDDMERHVREEMLRDARDDDEIEMQNFGRGGSSNPRLDRAGARSMGKTSPNAEGEAHVDPVLREAGIVLRPSQTPDERAQRAWELMQDGPPPPPYDSRRASSATANSISAPPQQVRSMLDI